MSIYNVENLLTSIFKRLRLSAKNLKFITDDIIQLNFFFFF